MRIIKKRPVRRVYIMSISRNSNNYNEYINLLRYTLRRDESKVVVKKRVALAGRGKSGGVRTLLAYKVGNKAFFVYGFAKNARANISADELKALKHLAKELLDYSDKALTVAIKHGALIEVENDE